MRRVYLFFALRGNHTRIFLWKRTSSYVNCCGMSAKQISTLLPVITSIITAINSHSVKRFPFLFGVCFQLIMYLSVAAFFNISHRTAFLNAHLLMWLSNAVPHCPDLLSRNYRRMNYACITKWLLAPCKMLSSRSRENFSPAAECYCLTVKKLLNTTFQTCPVSWFRLTVLSKMFSLSEVCFLWVGLNLWGEQSRKKPNIQHRLPVYFWP